MAVEGPGLKAENSKDPTADGHLHTK